MRGGWPSAAALLVIAASLALKLAVQHADVGEDQRAAVQALGDALVRDGYAVSVARPEVPVVQAQRAGCRLRARLLDPHGTYRDTELLKLPRGWTVAYGWRGSWRETLPRLGPLLEYYGARELARLDRAASRVPVIMLSSQSGCPRPSPAALDIRVSLQRVTTSI